MSSAFKLSELKIQPKLVTDDTALAAGGAITAMQWARFRAGRIEAMNGFTTLTTETFAGQVRGVHAHVDLLGGEVLSYATEQAFYSYQGFQQDVTPAHSEFFLNSPFTTVSGSNTVTVTNRYFDTDAVTTTTVAHNYQVGDSVSFVGAVAVGGLTVSGAYTIASIVSDTVYTITHASPASSTVTTNSGGYVLVRAPLRAGLLDGIGGLGFGTGTYGDGDYSLTSTVDYLPRVVSIDNFGENALYVPRDGGLYEYQPRAVWAEVNTGAWTLGAGWTGATTLTAAAGSASDASQPVSNGNIVGGKVYRITFTLAASAGTVTLKSGAIPLSPPLSVAGTYSFVFQAPPVPTDWKFTKDATFVGTISGISVTIAKTAYRIDEAPVRISSMFVDPARFVIALGATNAVGTYDPLLVRWSDQENLRSWVPSSANLAGEQSLSNGGRIVGGIPARQQNLIWTDAALFVMQFTGDASSPYSFRLAGTGCGLLGRNAAAEYNGIAFWLANTGQPYIFQGAVPQPIECPIREEIFDNLDRAQYEKVSCFINPAYNEVWWLLPDSRTGGECSRYVCYNWIDKAWSSGKVNRTMGVTPGIFGNPILFSTDGKIYSHEVGDTFNGGELSWSVQTSFTDIEDGDTLMAVSGFQPDFTNLKGLVTVTFYGRNAAQMPTRQLAQKTLTSASDFLWFRAMARQISVKIEGRGTPASGRFGKLLFNVQKTAANR